MGLVAYITKEAERQRLRRLKAENQGGSPWWERLTIDLWHWLDNNVMDPLLIPFAFFYGLVRCTTKSTGKSPSP